MVLGALDAPLSQKVTGRGHGLQNALFQVNRGGLAQDKFDLHSAVLRERGGFENRKAKGSEGMATNYVGASVDYRLQCFKCRVRSEECGIGEGELLKCYSASGFFSPVSKSADSTPA